MSRRTSRQNIRKRGTTYTYYAYVTGPDGARQQISKGGFATQAEAAAARLKLLSSVQDGTFVQPERITLRQFLVEDWLPAKQPPNLETSTYVSYERNIQIHVLPYIGNIRLQQVCRFVGRIEVRVEGIEDEPQSPVRGIANAHPQRLQAGFFEVDTNDSKDWTIRLSEPAEQTARNK